MRYVRALLLVLLAAVLMISSSALAQGETVYEVTVKQDGTIGEFELYAQLREIADQAGISYQYCFITIYNEATGKEEGTLVCKDHTSLPPFSGQAESSFTLEQEHEYTVQFIEFIGISNGLHYDFSIRGGSSSFKIKAVSENTTPPAPASPTISLAANSEITGTVTITEVGSDTPATLTGSSTDLSLNTEYTLRVSPNAEYAVEQIEIGGVNINPITYQNRDASVSFTPTEDINYSVSVRYIQPKMQLWTANSQSDGLPVYHLAEDTATTAGLISNVVNRTGSSPSNAAIKVEHYANGAWKTLDNSDELSSSGPVGTLEKVRFSFADSDRYPPCTEVIYIKLIPYLTIEIADLLPGVYPGQYEYEVTTDPANVPCIVCAFNKSTYLLHVELPAELRDKLGGLAYNQMMKATEGGMAMDEFGKYIDDLANKLDEIGTQIDTQAMRDFPTLVEQLLENAPEAASIRFQVGPKPVEPGDYYLLALPGSSDYELNITDTMLGEMRLLPLPATPPPAVENSAPPATGDSTPVAVYIAAAVFSLLGLTALWQRRTKCR